VLPVWHNVAKEAVYEYITLARNMLT
jgi:hypothetical protein